MQRGPPRPVSSTGAAGSTLMVEAPGTCCNASLSLTLTMSTEAQPAVRAPLKVPIGRTTVYGLVNNSSIFDYQCSEKSWIRWPKIFRVAISDTVVQNEFLLINKGTRSSDFQAEVARGLLCGFPRGAAGTLAGPRERPRLTDAADAAPGPPSAAPAASINWELFYVGFMRI